MYSPQSFFNSLAVHIKEANLVICLDDTNFAFLLNGDDIILRAESESDLENMLNVNSVWCHKLKLAISQSKTHKWRISERKLWDEVN